MLQFYNFAAAFFYNLPNEKNMLRQLKIMKQFCGRAP